MEGGEAKEGMVLGWGLSEGLCSLTRGIQCEMRPDKGGSGSRDRDGSKSSKWLGFDARITVLETWLST